VRALESSSSVSVTAEGLEFFWLLLPPALPGTIFATERRR
jgi:hypothetical protein